MTDGDRVRADRADDPADDRVGIDRADARDASVTLEVALAAPVVGLLVVGVLGMTAVVADQLVAERVARSAARAVAVTGTVGEAGAPLPAGARLAVERSGPQVTVAVTVPGTVGPLPYEVAATAVAVVEPALP